MAKKLRTTAGYRGARPQTTAAPLGLAPHSLLLLYHEIFSLQLKPQQRQILTSGVFRERRVCFDVSQKGLKCITIDLTMHMTYIYCMHMENYYENYN